MDGVTGNNSNSPPGEPQAPSEDRGKKWLAVLVAFMALLVSLTTWLQTDASNQAAKWSHIKQENVILSTGQRARGQLETAFANSMVRGYDELRDQAASLQKDNQLLQASAFITAAKEIAKQTPLLAAPYTAFDETDRRQLTKNSRYEADTWVITATRLSEKGDMASKAGDAWSSKGNGYKAATVVFAVVLFLIALAAIVNGFIRWLFVLVGVGLGTITFLGVLLTVVVPVTQIPDAAIELYAQGYGYTWQENYDQAIQAYNKALTIYPNYANALSRRGQAYLHTQPSQVGRAIQDLTAASRLADDNYNVFWNLGWAYYLAGDYARSIESSQSAQGLNSQICGPAFNIAIARLALGQPEQAERDYEAAITRCEKIVQASRAAGLAAPYTLWGEIEASAEDIENLLCQTHRRHCYPDREQHDVRNVVNRDAVLATGEKYLKRIKEAFTALEYLQTTAVKPSGARFEPLVFGTKFFNDAGDFQSYVVRDRFPHRGPSIYAMWDYAGADPDIQTVWKVYLDGVEKRELRYAETWGLAAAGSAVKKIDSWFVMDPGRYDVEVYGDGELLSTGTFTIDEKETLSIAAPANVPPAAPVNVGALVIYDDFVDNVHGWWSSSGSPVEGTAKDAVIANGEYRLIDHKKDTSWRVTCEACGSSGDFYYEATARQVSGPADYGYGLAFRGDRGMDQMYLFLIDEQGSYRIVKVVDGKYTGMTDWTRSTLIRPHNPNRLGVLARGSSFEFFINGQSATRITDAALPKGYIGLAVDTSELEVGFSQVRVWQVK